MSFSREPGIPSMPTICKIRVRGIPCNGDLGYYRFGFWIPCDDSVEIEVEPAVFVALQADPWLRVEALGEGSPGVADTADTADAAEATNAASAFSEVTDAITKSINRAIRQRGRVRH